MAQQKENIVMFPLMAQGHIIPFLALALQIQQRKGYKITFINTPQNISKIKSSLSPNSSIDFFEIPFSSIDHGLPPNIENTDSLPGQLIIQFLESTLSFKPTFKKLISNLVHEKDGHPPLCIITDMFFGWCAEIAHEFGIFHAIFCGSCGFGFACYYSLWLHMPHKSSGSDEFTLPDFPEVSLVHVSQLPDNLKVANWDDHYSIFRRKMLIEWDNADGILFNTVEELEKIGLTYFRRKIGRPVWPIGPVLRSTETLVRPGKEAGIGHEVCKDWLDTKPSNSVLYVSFGSQETLSTNHMLELAKALEGSGKNFIWVVRPPIGFDVNSEFNAQDWLPKGFEERMRESKRGLIVKNWAPQVEILSHKSICAFLSHCGWNSVLEALSQGVPIIGWPMAADQFFNAKLLEEEIGVCVEVARGKSCEVKVEEIKKKIEMVMDEKTCEKAKEMRKRACEVRDMIKDAIEEKEELIGSSVKAMDDFLNAALLMRKDIKTK